MRESVERYALARRGLPLAVTKQATLRGAWLPAAVRNGESPNRAQPIAMAPAADTPAATGDEPWWMEASERVPVESSSVSPSIPRFDTAPIVRVREEVRLDAPDSHDRARPQTPEVIRVQSLALPAPPLVSPPGDAPSDRAMAPALSPPAVPFVVTTTVVGSAPAASVPDEARAPASDRPVDQTARVTPGAPKISVLTFGAVAAPVERSRATHTELSPGRTEILVRQLADAALPEHSSTSETPRRRPGEPALVSVVETMGVPAAVPASPIRAPTADLTPLLAPARPNRGEIHIERVAVTVKVSGNTNAAPPAMALSSPPAAAPTAARGYRNPWASYFTRLD